MHTVARLAHGGVGEADDRERGQAGTDVDLYGHGSCVEPFDCERARASEHRFLPSTGFSAEGDEARARMRRYSAREEFHARPEGARHTGRSRAHASRPFSYRSAGHPHATCACLARSRTRRGGALRSLRWS
jgi:hypothetical protein